MHPTRKDAELNSSSHYASCRASRWARIWLCSAPLTAWGQRHGWWNRPLADQGWLWPGKLTPSARKWLQHACWVHQRGDFRLDNPEDVARLVQQVDPEQRCAVIWIAAPPCQDFTPVRVAPPGHSGSRGSLFLQSDNFWKAIAEKLGSRPTGWMYENVVMAHEHAARVSERLGVQPVMSCASDFGWISRPRLWWLHVDWSKWPCDPVTNEPLRWGKHFKWNRVRFEGVRKAVADFQLDGLSFHPAVVSGRLKLPCATTPAESDNGRLAPRHSRGKVPEQTKQRWLQDCRQLAPWHYAEEAMMTNAAGQLVNIPPIIREQLHDMPPQFTAVRVRQGQAPHGRQRLALGHCSQAHRHLDFRIGEQGVSCQRPRDKLPRAYSRGKKTKAVHLGRSGQLDFSENSHGAPRPRSWRPSRRPTAGRR